MKLLLLTIDFPLPVDAGGVARLLGLSEALARRGHELHMLAKLRAGATDLRQVDALSARLGGAPVEIFGPSHFPAPAGAARAAGRWGYALATGTPPWVWSAYSRHLAARARALAPTFDAALILDDHAHTFALDLRGLVPVVLDKQNVLAASWGSTNHWAGEAPPSAAQRAQQALALSLVQRWEHRVVSAADAVIVTSAAEAERFGRHHGLPCETVPSAIDAPRLVADPQHAPPTVVWLGDHNYHANVHGLLRFLREGWRPLGERGVRLAIAGRNPGPQVLALAAELPGVDVLGFVEDLDGLLAGAAAAVVPLWKGAGIKMKTLALMGAGLPVATTPVGIEGIAAQDGIHARVASEPAALAAAVGELVAERSRAAELGLAGRALILEAHTWDGAIPGVEATLERVARHPRR